MMGNQWNTYVRVCKYCILDFRSFFRGGTVCEPCKHKNDLKRILGSIKK